VAHPPIYRIAILVTGDSIDREVEEYRFNRQREVLQDRLKKLEALKSADAVALFRSKDPVLLPPRGGKVMSKDFSVWDKPGTDKPGANRPFWSRHGYLISL